MGMYRNDVLYALLAVVGSSAAPIGTRAAQRSLDGMGMPMSESSVSRRLRELDGRGWTVPVERKGRVLSPRGRRQLAEVEHVKNTESGTIHPVNVKDVRDMLELLFARKAVESAAAADAAAHASEEDVKALRALLEEHRATISSDRLPELPGIGFHRKIAAIAPNSKLKVLTGLILAPHLDGVEAVLDLILSSDHHQRVNVAEHQEIVDAIADQDPDRAEKAMHEHFKRMILAGEKFIHGDGEPMVERLLAWLESRPL